MVLLGFLSYGQTVTKVFNNTPLKTVLKEVEKQSGMSIMYETVDVNASPAVTASFNNASVTTVLETILDSTLEYSIKGKIIVIYKKSGDTSGEKQQAFSQQSNQRTIRGGYRRNRHPNCGGYYNSKRHREHCYDRFQRCIYHFCKAG